MLIFDIGFFDGNDTDYFLRKGANVVAFEAHPHLAAEGAKRFSEAIAKQRLNLNNEGIANEEGVLDFFVNKINLEWSSFYREAALNWGAENYEIVKVPCITPKSLFAKYGIPDYLKVDIEGYDIYIAEYLKQLERKPQYVSFEASNRQLIRELVLAGYDSFKMVDQGKVPSQVETIHGETYHFPASSTGGFGDNAPGEWLSFENAMYLYFRFEDDLFATSVPRGSWWDIHAARGQQTEMEKQKAFMTRFIEQEYGCHCGLYGAKKPKCPFILEYGKPALPPAAPSDLQRLRQLLFPNDSVRERIGRAGVRWLLRLHDERFRNSQ